MLKKIFLILGIVLAPALLLAQDPGKVPDKYGQTYADNAYIRYGNSEDFMCGYNTAQTPDAMYCGASVDSNNMVLGEKGDKAYDFAHAQSTDPTLYIQSHNQSATQWVSLKHDATNGVLDVGAGVVSIPDGVTTAGTVVSSRATDIGWSVVAGANTACNTTCTNACVFGQDTSNFAIVNCAAATADVCVCAGAN